MRPIDTVRAQIASEADILPLPTSPEVVREALAVTIVGSRQYPQLDRVERLVSQLHSQAIVLSGGAEGVDTRATAAAIASGRAAVEFKPFGYDRESWVRAAFARNGFLALAGLPVAFWDGVSDGTRDTIRKALNYRGFCIVALPDQEPEVWVPRL